MRVTARRRVRAILGEIESLIPYPWHVDTMVDRLAEHRSRPILLLPWDFPFTACRASGLWIPTDRADYIFYNRSATPTVRQQIIGHELAHMLLGHAPPLAEAPTSLLEALAPSLSPALTRRLLQAARARTSYDLEEEAVAEEFGTRLVRLGASKRQAGGRDELGRLTDALQ